MWGSPCSSRGVVSGRRLECTPFFSCFFGERRKIFKVHFRNVDRPLPHFVETFLDNGYMDMSKVMQALRDVDFNGVAIPDHIPQMADDGRVGTAYTIGYMNALVERANAEAG